MTNTTQRWGIREYIDLGDEHIRNVGLTNYIDELLTDSIGEEVALSIIGSKGKGGGRKAVMAIRTERRGLVKALSLSELIGELFFKTLFKMLFGILIGFILWGVLAKIIGQEGNFNIVLLGACVLLCMLFRLLKARMIYKGWTDPTPLPRQDYDASAPRSYA